MSTYTTVRAVDEVTNEIEVPVSWGNHRLLVRMSPGKTMEEACQDAVAEVIDAFGPQSP